jgi:hypothetical protein
LTNESLFKSLQKFNQRGLLTIDNSLKNIAKELKIDKKDLNSNRFDNIIDSLKYTENLRENVLIKREILSKQKEVKRVYPTFRRSIYKDTLNICNSFVVINRWY